MFTMRRRRLKIEDGCYHVVSRISGRRFLLDDGEKAILLRMIRAAAEFSGVEVYTYAIMTNHFHLLVRVPRARDVPDGELEGRVMALYGGDRADKVFKKWENWEGSGMAAKVVEEKARLRARMYNISQFCKTFKETYTQDYNRRTGNTGTIWEGRFKSNLIEPSGHALAAVAAYIHLNPARAGVAGKPENSKWTGYGAACAGRVVARFGLCDLVALMHHGREMPWRDVREAFATLHKGKLFDSGTRRPGSPQMADMRELIRHRTAGFIQGEALGSQEFIEGIAGQLPERSNARMMGTFDERPELGFTSAAGVR